MELTGVNEIINILINNFPESIKRELKIRELKDENYFGCCSICGGHNWYLNIKSAQYFVCHKHKKRWCLGYNMFTDWKEENEKIWKKNFKKIWKYDDISGNEWYNKKKKEIEQKFPNELPRHILRSRIENIKKIEKRAEIDDII